MFSCDRTYIYRIRLHGSRVDIQLTHAHNVGGQISKANRCGGDEAKVEGVKECPVLRIDTNTYIISTQAQERGECECVTSHSVNRRAPRAKKDPSTPSTPRIVMMLLWTLLASTARSSSQSSLSAESLEHIHIIVSTMSISTISTRYEFTWVSSA